MHPRVDAALTTLIKTAGDIKPPHWGFIPRLDQSEPGFEILSPYGDVYTRLRGHMPVTPGSLSWALRAARAGKPTRADIGRIRLQYSPPLRVPEMDPKLPRALPLLPRARPFVPPAKLSPTPPA